MSLNTEVLTDNFYFIFAVTCVSGRCDPEAGLEATLSSEPRYSCTSQTWPVWREVTRAEDTNFYEVATNFDIIALVNIYSFWPQLFSYKTSHYGLEDEINLQYLKDI